MRSVAATIVLITTAACTPGSNEQLNMMMANNHMSIEASEPGASYDYKLTFKNVFDITYDLDKPADRAQFIRGAMASTCSNPVVIDEKRVATSKALTGREFATYTVFIDCQ